jgi:hypothetical protein
MPIVFTITLPDDGEDACLLVKKGNFAHLMRFKAGSREEMLFAILAAQSEIDALEANPPQIEVATSETVPIAVSKDKSSKASKPKKKKVALDDIPDEDVDWGEADTEEIPVEEIAKAEPKSVQSGQSVPMPKKSVSVQVGDMVNLSAGAVDADGDPVPFQQGRIVEIDHDAESPRVWLESMDGEQDAWVKLADLEAKPNPFAEDLQAIFFGLKVELLNHENKAHYWQALEQGRETLYAIFAEYLALRDFWQTPALQEVLQAKLKSALDDLDSLPYEDVGALAKHLFSATQVHFMPTQVAKAQVPAKPVGMGLPNTDGQLTLFS